MRRIARITGANRKLVNAGIAQHTHRGLRQDFGMALRVSDNLSIVVGGCEQVRVRRVLSRQRRSPSPAGNTTCPFFGW